MAIEGAVELFISPVVIQEFREVTARPRVIAKLRLIDERVEMFIESIELAAILLQGFPLSFSYERDPDDAHYINLALAARAQLVVSRDRDLLDLMDINKT